LRSKNKSPKSLNPSMRRLVTSDAIITAEKEREGCCLLLEGRDRAEGDAKMGLKLQSRRYCYMLV
jgi:hypothetical protein